MIMSEGYIQLNNWFYSLAANFLVNPKNLYVSHFFGRKFQENWVEGHRNEANKTED